MNSFILFANSDGNLIAVQTQIAILHYSINFQMAKADW